MTLCNVILPVNLTVMHFTQTASQQQVTEKHTKQKKTMSYSVSTSIMPSTSAWHHRLYYQDATLNQGVTIILDHSTYSSQFLRSILFGITLNHDDISHQRVSAVCLALFACWGKWSQLSTLQLHQHHTRLRGIQRSHSRLPGQQSGKRQDH